MKNDEEVVGAFVPLPFYRYRSDLYRDCWAPKELYDCLLFSGNISSFKMYLHSSSDVWFAMKRDEEQIRHAMADPEIQSILKDPQINLFLKSMQENPASAQEAMAKDPKIANAVTKLMAAGILRTQ